MTDHAICIPGCVCPCHGDSEDWRFNLALVRDAVGEDTEEPEHPDRHTTTCEMLVGIGRRNCTCPYGQGER